MRREERTAVREKTTVGNGVSVSVLQKISADARQLYSPTEDRESTTDLSLSLKRETARRTARACGKAERCLLGSDLARQAPV